MTPAGGERLPGVQPEAWSEPVRDLLGDAHARVAAAVGSGSSPDAANPLPTLTLIAHQEGLLGPFLVWARALADGRLPRRSAELVALRTAYLCGSEFEWREHRLYAQRAGVTDQELTGIRIGPAAPIWSEADRALLRAADDLHRFASIAPATWTALQAELTPAELVEVVLVAGQYRMLSMLANSAGVDHTLGNREGMAQLPPAFGIDDDLLGLRDAVAVVTGATRSIGRGCAVALARAGCRVVVADVADGQSAVEEIESLGRPAFFHRTDVRLKPSIEGLVDATVERFGRLDVAVNTVGGTKGPKPFLDIGLDEWEEVVALNLSTAMLSTQVEALAMVRLGIPGRIVNVASLSGLEAAPNAAGYGAANAGVVHLTRSAASELGRYGIRVNCIVPGTHATETVREAVDRDPRMGEWVRLVGGSTPLGRIGEVAETAGLAVFLASNLSAYMTGQEVVSDGGVQHTTSRPPMGMDAEAEAVRNLAGATRRPGPGDR